MFALALAALLAAPARAAGDAPLLTVVSRRTIATASFVPVSAPAPVTAPLSLVVEDGSGWDAPGRLEGVLGKASAIFARCGVALGDAEVVTVRWTPEALRRLNAVNPYAAPAETGVLSEPLLPRLRPVGFLFGRTIPSTAKAFNQSSVEVFRRSHPEAAAMLDTFWITIDQETRPRRADELPSYSVFAHELTHLFGDLGHTPARPNLMTDADSPGSKSGDLLDAQCVEVRRLHGLP